MELYSNYTEDFQHIPLGEQSFPSPLCSKGTLTTAANNHYSDSVTMNVYTRERDSKRIMCIQLDPNWIHPNHDLCTLKRAMSWITMDHSWISCISRNSQFISLNIRLMVHIWKQKNNVTHLIMNNLLELICLHWLHSKWFLLCCLGKEIDREIFMPFPKWIRRYPLERHMKLQNPKKVFLK